jgi:DTW domain-containing protein
VSRRANAQVRCARCRVHQSLCFCDQIPRIETKTRLLLVVHRREERKPTNTGRLATECLANSEIFVRGHADGSDRGFVLDPTRQPLLLFPDESAIRLTEFLSLARPLTLIVPDGNWRQASKVRKRLPGLGDVPIVALPQGPTSTYRLRHESRDGGLATIEAIARAFGVLEGASVQQALERVFRIMVERTLWARGSLDSIEGLEVGTLRHDPLSGAARTKNQR